MPGSGFAASPKQRSSALSSRLTLAQVSSNSSGVNAGVEGAAGNGGGAGVDGPAGGGPVPSQLGGSTGAPCIAGCPAQQEVARHSFAWE